MAEASWLICALANWARPRGGWVFGSEHKLAVAPRRGRKPDVTVYAPGVKLSAKASLSRTAPLVVVEVVSSRARDVRRDRVEKLAEYAAFGVSHYWLVDPETRLFELLELGADGRYVLARAALDGSIEPPGCEGLTLDLDGLAAEVAELDAGEAEDED